MNVYEHGIEALADEWDEALRVICTTNLPTYTGFTRAMIDREGRSLVERVIRVAEVAGPHRLEDYNDEYDLRYSLLAVLYHLNRLIDLYVGTVRLFENLYPAQETREGNIDEPRIFHELDALLTSARITYEYIRKVLWRYYGGPCASRWKSIKATLTAQALPTDFQETLNESWYSFGERLADYRDCIVHCYPVTNGQTTCWVQRYGSRWGAAVTLPTNPEVKSRAGFKFAGGPDALSYSHALSCHLADLCSELIALEPIRTHLKQTTT